MRACKVLAYITCVLLLIIYCLVFVLLDKLQALTKPKLVNTAIRKIGVPVANKPQTSGSVA